MVHPHIDPNSCIDQIEGLSEQIALRMNHDRRSHQGIFNAEIRSPAIRLKPLISLQSDAQRSQRLDSAILIHLLRYVLAKTDPKPFTLGPSQNESQYVRLVFYIFQVVTD